MVPAQRPAVGDVLKRNLIFVSGKGGVGKTVVAHAIALALSRKGRRTLWIEIEDPLQPPSDLKQVGPRLWHLNCEAQSAFEQYAFMRVGDSLLARLFIENKLMRYLAKAAPGIHELVLLGKVWHERTHFDSVVVDMPSTGHGLAMFQSTKNFAALFRGGPIQADAEAMLETFGNPALCGHVIVALPEEMPLQEGLELDDLLRDLFPTNRASFLVNRLFPKSDETALNAKDIDPNPVRWASPVPNNTADYVTKRLALENFNLRLWREKDIPFSTLDFIAPPETRVNETVAQNLSRMLEERGLV